MFQAVGLYEEPRYLYSRGSGCPFMFPFRRFKWAVVDAVADLVARTRTWSPGHGRRTRRPGGLVLPERMARIEKRPDVSPLTDPRARARARIKGTLLPDTTPD